MGKPLDPKNTAALACAVAAASLMVPAPAQAQVWYDEACVQYYIDHCEANWQALGFPSPAKCASHHKETVCSYVYDPGGDVPQPVAIESTDPSRPAG
ncbi:MAG TPA: hypothetical protein VF548_17670 [Allosphingosinicella sp.]|jgi:hypothetical protein